MTTFFSDIAGKQNQIINGTGPLTASGQSVSGNVVMARAVVTLTGAEVTGDVMNLVRLPKHVVVLPNLCSVTSEATGLTVKVGDGQDSSRYASSLPISTAKTTNGFTGGTDAMAPVPTEEPCWMTATVVSGTAAAGKKAVFCIAYILP